MGKDVKNVLIAIVIVVLLCVSAVGGLYLAQVWQDPVNTETEKSSQAEKMEGKEADNGKKLYLKIVGDLEDKDYEAAYKKLTELKENSSDWESMKNVKEIYYYTRAKLYLKEGNKLSAEEILSKIKDDYGGEFSKDIKEMKLAFAKGKKNDTANEKVISASDNVDALESQRLLVSKKENILVRMNNQIAAIYDKQSREDIAYKEGFLGIKDYFKNKAQNEVDIQKIRLNAANEEIEAINETRFVSQEEKKIELDTAVSKKARVEQELQKAYTAQNEVAGISASFDKAMQQYR